MPFKILRMVPVTLLTLAGLLLSWWVDKLGILYDSGGLSSIMFYLGWLLQLLVEVAHDALRQFNLSRQADLTRSITIGLGFAVLIDFGLNKIRRRRT